MNWSDHMPTEERLIETENQISPLEKECLNRLVSGLSPHAIAEELNISPAQAAGVLDSLKSKLGVTSTAALVRHGILAGL
jgi:DNA-binding CsgD family transcriptional regulator